MSLASLKREVDKDQVISCVRHVARLQEVYVEKRDKANAAIPHPIDATPNERTAYQLLFQEAEAAQREVSTRRPQARARCARLDSGPHIDRAAMRKDGCHCFENAHGYIGPCPVHDKVVARELRSERRFVGFMRFLGIIWVALATLFVMAALGGAHF